MDNKKELNQIFNDLYHKLKEYFPMVTEDFDLKEAKELLINDDDIVTVKQRISVFFMRKLSEYINAKYQLVKRNIIFQESNIYNYKYEYDNARYFYKLSNNIIQELNYTYPTLKKDMTIEDCKDLIFEFYKDLFKDDNLRISIIKNIIYNRTKIKYDGERSVSDVYNKSMEVDYTNNLSFLLSLTHEAAHTLVNYSIINNEETDNRLMEVESLFCEKLLLKYLYKNKIKVFEENNKVRPLYKKDIDSYIINMYNIIMYKSSRIIEEYTFKNSLTKEGKFNIHSFTYYSDNSLEKEDMFDAFLTIDDVLNNYLPEEKRCLSKKDLLRFKHSYSYGELDSLEVEMRYLFSYILSFYFMELMDNEEIVNNFKDYLKNAKIYNFSEFLSVLKINYSQIPDISTSIINKYKEILDKRGYIFETNKEISNNIMEKRLKIYKYMVEEYKSNPWKGTYYNSLVYMGYLINKDAFDTDKINPYDLEFQLEDEELDEYLKHKEIVKKLEKKLKK